MNLRGISYYLALSFYPITLLSFFNILYSSYFDHYINFDSYILTLVISFLSGITLYFFSKNSEKNISFNFFSLFPSFFIDINTVLFWELSVKFYRLIF